LTWLSARAVVDSEPARTPAAASPRKEAAAVLAARKRKLRALVRPDDATS
jgi:hypothetical protein